MRDFYGYKFAAFILTHGRAGRVITYRALRRQGYTGDIYLLVDDSDKQIDEYRSRYPGEVIVFSKRRAQEITDTMGNFVGKEPRGVVFARNICFDVARELGLDYFLELDDDYQNFYYRYALDADGKIKFVEIPVSNLDVIFRAYLDFLARSGVDCVAMAQSGDFIGDTNSGYAAKIWPWRKVMNVLFHAVARRVEYIGLINEDVNMYLSLGNVGRITLTCPIVSIHQVVTQHNPGGLTDIYRSLGTYVKSFFSVIVNPAAVKVSVIGQRQWRVHHQIDSDAAYVKILSPDFRKPRKAKMEDGNVSGTSQTQV